MNEKLEALERLKENSYYLDDKNMQEDLEIIKQALTTKSKKEQAFDIIKNKCVDMYRFKIVGSADSYNKWIEFDEYWLTQEEFDLLKEVLKND